MPSSSSSSVTTEPAATKKRAPKSTKSTKTQVQVQPPVSEPTVDLPVATKGRKTRSSKIVTKQQIAATVTTPALTNIILNLKCSMSELKDYNDKLSRMISNPLEYNSSAPPEVKYYDGEKTFGAFIQTEQDANNISENDDRTSSLTPFISFSTEEEHTNNNNIPNIANNIIQNSIQNDSYSTDFELRKIPEEPTFNATEENDDVNIKDMSAKLKQLKIQLYKNTLGLEKKSACFWCTYDFDNAPCYIPKYEMDGIIYGYGSFCRPECAVAHLMEEPIDDSTKFERYHLLNQIYGKVYNCKKNIKPAPDPHYLLDKFYGNMTIQEYRRLLKTEHLLLVIDKPLTRILPELHEDTDDAFTKIYGIKATSGNSSGVYKVKRQSEQPNGPSKASIIKSTFGI
jgi:hypothetical protein